MSPLRVTDPKGSTVDEGAGAYLHELAPPHESAHGMTVEAQLGELRAQDDSGVPDQPQAEQLLHVPSLGQPHEPRKDRS